MTNLEHLEEMKKRDIEWLRKNDVNPKDDFLTVTLDEWRKVKALEIIAESLIKIDTSLNTLVRLLK